MWKDNIKIELKGLGFDHVYWIPLDQEGTSGVCLRT
jgi:hypothetical protein